MSPGRHVSEVDVSKPPKQKPGLSNQSVGTPWEFVHAVERRWGKLTIDLAASAENTKVADNFIDEHDDSLANATEWKVADKKIRAWLNPPFARIKPWASKCEFQ